jgi:hypothetical protein
MVRFIGAILIRAHREHANCHYGQKFFVEEYVSMVAIAHGDPP